MPTGKHTLVLNYNVQQVDPNIPNYHGDLLTAWLSHNNHHIRINPPVTLADILHEPLFRNPFIAIYSNTFYHRDWIQAGLVIVGDLCYSVIPAFIPALAIHEILTHDDYDPKRTLHQTTQQLTQIQRAFPPYSTNTIHTYCHKPTYSPTYFCPSKP